MSEQPVARWVVVRGRVQGVSFRDGCRREAQSAGVAGWVANHDDGSVRLHVEGPADAVERLLAWCRTGPSGAEVSDVDAREDEVRQLSRFEVR